MNMFITRIKLMLRNTGNVFWTFVFPLCMGTFFYLGFGTIDVYETLKTTDIHVASEVTDQNLLTVMNEVEIAKDMKLFNVIQEFNKEQLETKLTNQEIDTYIYIENNEIILRLASNGLTQTIVKNFLDQYLQANALAYKVSVVDPTKLEAVMTDLMNSKTYFEEIKRNTNPNVNPMITYFYALIAMTCMFASFWGIRIVNDIQANMSSLAARFSVSPTHKMKVIVIYFLAALVVQFIGTLILLVYLKYILGIEFSKSMGLVILATFIGCISGIALGTFLSSFIKGSLAKKEGFMTVVSLLLSALSGLMVWQLKYLVSKHLPFLGYINPSSLITETLYSLYYYDDLSKYFFNLIILVVLSVILLIGTFFKMRGYKYDSI